jgi:2',3'-cyclic-nucleotide 2'-phosphodiesterase (5'-nucleotidase family)
MTLALIISSFIGMGPVQLVKAAGTGTLDSPYTVAQAIGIQDNSIASVQGYIVGQPTSGTTVITTATGDTAIALADTAGETDTTKMLFVQLPTTPASLRADLGLKTNPTVLGKLVIVTGNLTPYFTPHPGLKNTSAYSWANTANVIVSGVTLDQSTLTLSLGQTSPLAATIVPSTATNKNVTWSSNNTAVATVTNGFVTGISEGTATITVTTEDGGFTSICVVTVSANAPPVNKTFDIVEITDFHGQLLDSTNTKPVGAALAKVVKDVKNANPNRTLIIGGGDLYQGTPVSNVLHGVPVQQVMSNIGMEVTALGNHEFDWGLNVINTETMKDANYSIVSANMYNKGTNDRPYEPYKIITKDGVRIAVIGAILKDAPTIIMPALVAPFDFRDPAVEINACAKEIRDGNLADIVLADVHDGGSSLDTIVSNLHGVDAVFGGHTHTSGDVVNKDAEGKDVPTLNAASTGKGFIDLKITVDPTNKVVGFSSKGTNWKALTVTTTSATDPECKKIVDDASAALLPIFNEVIGNDAVAYTSSQVDSPYGESQLGNWMADVVKNYPGSPADVGMVNNGGIRLSPVPAGDITVGTIFNIMPFDNTVCTTTMTGAQLRFIFEQAVQTGGKGIQISGVKFAYDSTKPSYKPAVVAADGTITTPEVPGQRVLSIVRESDGTVVNDTDTLKVNAPDFVATGGDTFTGFLVSEIVKSLIDSHYTVRDALNADVRANHKITVVMNNRVDNQMVVADPVVMSIAEARTTTKTAVILTGTVSAVNGKNVFMQDNAVAPTAGICVYNSGGTTFTAHKGDTIKVTGNLSVYNGLLELTPTSAANVTTLSTGNVVIPKEVTVNQITNAIQGQLIKVKNVTFTSIDNAGASMVQDSTGSVTVYAMPVVAGLAAGDTADVTAAVTCYGSTMELAVDSASDVVKTVTPAPSPAKISIVGTSDLHGAIYPLDYNTGLAANVGLAKVSTYVNNLRASNPNTMLIDNGDTIQGTPLVYYYNMIDQTTEYPMMKVMGAMGYDSWTLGNHEFNYGLTTLNRIMSDAAKEKISVLSANTYKTDNTNFVKPYIIKSFNVNGKTIKVGILGLTTKTIPSWEDPAHYAGLQFNDLVSEAQKWVPMVKSAGADVVIVSAHTGTSNVSDTIPENQADLIAKQVSGIDAILCGHAHTGKTYSFTNPDGKVVPVVEPKNGDGIFSQIDLNIDVDGNFVGVNAYNVTLPAETAADPAILAIAQPYQDATLAYTNTVIGQSTAVFEGTKQLTEPSSIMELVNKVQMNAANSQLSIAAPLSLSARIPQGDIKRQDIMGVYVYENFLYGVNLTGKQLKNWLEWSVRYYKQTTSASDAIVKDPVLKIADYNLDQLYGATYDIDLSQPACTTDSTGLVVSGDRIKNLKFNGKLVKETDSFKVAVNNYRYNGGGGFMAAAGLTPGSAATIAATYYDSAKALGDDGQVRNMMFKYVQDNGTISPTNSNNWKVSTVPVVQQVEVTGVTLNKTTLNLEVGKTETLISVITPENATNKNVVWNSSDENVAYVDQNGIVTIKNPGTANITVTTVDGGFTETCAITAVVPVIGVSIDKEYLSLKPGEDYSLVATIMPTNATNKGVTWSSSDPNVAAVDANGKVTGKTIGTTVITVTTNDGKYTASTNVAIAAVPVRFVNLSRNSIIIENGKVEKLVANINPGNVSVDKLIWTVDNPDLVTISSDGKFAYVTGNKSGTAKITVTTFDGGYTDTCTVVIYPSFENTLIMYQPYYLINAK